MLSLSLSLYIYIYIYCTAPNVCTYNIHSTCAYNVLMAGCRGASGWAVGRSDLSGPPLVISLYIII